MGRKDLWLGKLRNWHPSWGTIAGKRVVRLHITLDNQPDRDVEIRMTPDEAVRYGTYLAAIGKRLLTEEYEIAARMRELHNL